MTRDLHNISFQQKLGLLEVSVANECSALPSRCSRSTARFRLRPNSAELFVIWIEAAFTGLQLYSRETELACHTYSVRRSTMTYMRY
jgi:hypothetical protein